MSGIARCWWHCSWKLTLASLSIVSGALANSGDCALSQITPDGTLPNNSIVTPQGNTSVISGGTQAGSNLFHSFEQFSVPTGGAASFNNGLDIQNIFSRVTGKSISNIDGLLRANGTANLFLLNPNGIIFGPNASLNIGGSFVGSTASSLKFTNGTQFSATAPQSTPLLTVSVPLGLQFGGNAGGIQVQGNGQGLIDDTVGLRIPPNQTLALVGGDITLEGGALKTDGGRIELGSVASPDLVSLTTTEKGWFLGYDGVQKFGNIQLFQQTAVDASGEGGGDVQVHGSRVILQNGSRIAASTRGAKPSGNLKVTALELLELSGTTAESNIPRQFKGAIALGNLPSAIDTSVTPGATGAGGNLIIETARLRVLNGAQITSATFAEGFAGNLSVKASESVELSGTSTPDGGYPSVLASSVEQGATGTGGNLNLETRQLILRGGAQISSATASAGAAGNSSIRVSDFVELSGISADGIPTGLFTSADDGAIGAGGNLTLETKQLIVRDGAQIQTGTFGPGPAGNLLIKASDSMELSGEAVNAQFPSGFIAGVALGATGAGGNLTVETRQLILRDGASILTSTRGEGAAGNLSVKASESVEVIGISVDGIFASLLTSQTAGAGDAGDLKIETGRLTIQDEAEVTVSSRASGKAGNLEVQARSISLDNKGVLLATTRSGNGGNITLQIGNLLLLRRGSLISASAGTVSAGGDGGNITINVPDAFIVAFPKENSDITANAFSGSGGRVEVTAQSIFGLEQRSRQELQTLLEPDEPLDPARLPSNDITAISQTNPELSGTVTFNSPNVDPSQGLATLPAELIDASRLIASSCGAGGKNEFIVTGRGGLPPSPSELLSSETVWTDLRQTTQLAQHRPSSEEATAPANSAPTQIVEAQGWVINGKGEVMLTATVPNVTPHSPWIPSATCHTPQASS